jgi:RNA polymerase sigma-70 factor (ECF subfamily)
MTPLAVFNWQNDMLATPQPDPAQWLDQYGDYLYRYALMRVRDETVAEDMVQETLLAAWQGYERFAGRGAERTWLTGILKHKVIDYFRKASRETQIDPLAEERLENDDLFRADDWAGHFRRDTGPADWALTPAQALEQKEFWTEFQRCLGALPERIANAFTLREVEECSSQEVCDILCVSPNNLWVMLHRARMQLRRCVETRWFRQH